MDGIRWYGEENGKWVEVAEVPLKKPQKNKETGEIRTHTNRITKRTAKENGLIPSVTSVLKCVIHKGGKLDEWKRDQIILACINNPYTGDPSSEEQVAIWKSDIIKEGNRIGKEAADRGTALHKDVQSWCENFFGKDLGHDMTPDDPASAVIVNTLDAWLKDNKVKSVTCELSLGSKALGYAGTPDIIADTDSHRFIIDLKTTSLKEKGKPITNVDRLKRLMLERQHWPQQLGAYRNLSGGEGTLVQMLSDRDNGMTFMIPYSESEVWAKRFEATYDAYTGYKGVDFRS